ncbi:MAG TPA: hypothetical protein VD948_08830 [Rhodothermales bacterium]|nr:hypothetical protein [Rhodothermales bacterium]
MSKPRLLDLFSGAGGCARGYQLAGFHVTGVDLKPQPRYAGDVFIQGDALEYVREHGHEYDAIHASPPCQAFTRAKFLRIAQGRSTQAPDLIEPTRAALAVSGKPYAIENVEGAPLIDPVLLCGSMFGLRVRRHRLFETNVFLLRPVCQHATAPRPVGVHSWGKWGHEIPSGGKLAASLEDAQDAMGIDWMKRPELAEAIPPAYTLFIGRQLLAALTRSQDTERAAA